MISLLIRAVTCTVCCASLPDSGRHRIARVAEPVPRSREPKIAKPSPCSVSSCVDRFPTMRRPFLRSPASLLDTLVSSAERRIVALSPAGWLHSGLVGHHASAPAGETSRYTVAFGATATTAAVTVCIAAASSASASEHRNASISVPRSGPGRPRPSTTSAWRRCKRLRSRRQAVGPGPTRCDCARGSGAVELWPSRWSLGRAARGPSQRRRGNRPFGA